MPARLASFFKYCWKLGVCEISFSRHFRLMATSLFAIRDCNHGYVVGHIIQQRHFSENAANMSFFDFPAILDDIGMARLEHVHVRPLISLLEQHIAGRQYQ